MPASHMWAALPLFVLCSWRVRALSAPSCLEQTPKNGGSQKCQSMNVPRQLGLSTTWAVKELVRLHQDVLKDGPAGCEINHAASLSGEMSTPWGWCVWWDVSGVRAQFSALWLLPHSPSGRAGSAEPTRQSQMPLGCSTLSLRGW